MYSLCTDPPPPPPLSPNTSLLQGNDESWLELPIDQIKVQDHIKVHELRDPDSETELHSLMGLYMGLPLSKTRPLWQVVLVPRFKGGSAMMFHLHHCLVDGAAGAIVVDSLSDKPMQWPQQPQPPLWRRLLQQLVLWVTLVISSPFVILLAVKMVLFGDRVSPIKPKSLNGGRRKVGISEAFEVNDIKGISRAAGCTVNDLGLSLITQALRDQVAALFQLLTGD